jgi:hypothetical protein
MLRSRTFHFSLGTAIGAILILFSLNLAPCANSNLPILNGEKSLLPCPASPLSVPLVKATKKAGLTLVVPAGIAVRVGDSFPVTLELDATATPVNAVDVALTYPTSSVRLVSKDESVSPFAIQFGDLPSDALNETMQVQPSPGVQSVATLARFTFQALGTGTATITVASSSRVLANDGFGTDVLGSIKNISLTIQ